ncbi:methylated-DNA--protein-cysteine methyltransferase [Shewanella sp. NFH-SH190041]|uniref:methylated-DNA--[protein]-cysteine S-methyltransferase n=1 Tax=Shewanella sp. NFH-SH190041 TaxID=2950245 RepID=UPI0021C33402|nr:methylated-DNA--[protein]-cysteine S-methyltransferase [Shewanella sp. NFH-SH190041]BDM65174.1 methylated-DNA--protein-cysteine methyltransferase [Shewanella sp. NFH-SH190041]
MLAPIFYQQSSDLLGLCQVDSPVGRLQLTASAQGLVSVLREDQPSPVTVVVHHPDVEAVTTHLVKTATQLNEYFAGQRQQFDLALDMRGTAFQQQVWQTLLAIEYGHHCAYVDIAQRINRPNACRAVGAANGANPIAIIVPCHRVIGKSGKLTGYAYGVEMKQFLLDLEQRYA